MRQLCNVAYVAQASVFTDEREFEAWEAGLNVEPGEVPRRKTHIDPALLGMLGQ